MAFQLIATGSGHQLRVRAPASEEDTGSVLLRTASGAVYECVEYYECQSRHYTDVDWVQRYSALYFTGAEDLARLEAHSARAHVPSRDGLKARLVSRGAIMRIADAKAGVTVVVEESDIDLLLHFALDANQHGLQRVDYVTVRLVLARVGFA